MEIHFVDVLILLICIYLLSEMKQLNSRVKGLKYTLDQIYKQSNAPEDPLRHELQQLLQEGNEIEAVKRVRETLGLSLLESKKYVDALKLDRTS